MMLEQVREQALSVLWNLSCDERVRTKIAELELVQVLLATVDSEGEAEKEAAVGVLANLSCSPCNHTILTKAGVIPKFVSLFCITKSLHILPLINRLIILLEIQLSLSVFFYFREDMEEIAIS